LVAQLNLYYKYTLDSPLDQEDRALDVRAGGRSHGRARRRADGPDGRWVFNI